MLENKTNFELEAKIEKALSMLEPAFKSGQYKNWNKQVEDFVIATLKSYPEMTLGFVSNLSKISISNLGDRQKQKHSIRDNVAGDNTFYPDNLTRDFPIVNKIRIMGRNSKELGEKEANLLIPERLKKYIEYDEKKKENKIKNENELSKTDADIIKDAILYDKLDKLSDEGYANLFMSMQKLEDGKLDFKNLSKDEDNDFLLKKCLFHELNHAVSTSEFVLKQGFPFITSCVGADKQYKSMLKKGDRYVDIEGGIPFRTYCYVDLGKWKVDENYSRYLFLHEGITEELAFEKMNLAYPESDYDYTKKSMSYFPFALTAKCINFMYDDALKKAYYGGISKFDSSNENRLVKLIDNITLQMNLLCSEYYNLTKKTLSKDFDEQKSFKNLKDGAIRLQNVLYFFAINELDLSKNDEKKQEDVKKALDVISFMTTSNVWSFVRTVYSPAKGYGFYKELCDDLQLNYKLLEDSYKNAEQKGEAEKRKFINAELTKIYKNFDASLTPLERLENYKARLAIAEAKKLKEQESLQTVVKENADSSADKKPLEAKKTEQKQDITLAPAEQGQPLKLDLEKLKKQQLFAINELEKDKILNKKKFVYNNNIDKEPITKNNEELEKLDKKCTKEMIKKIFINEENCKQFNSNSVKTYMYKKAINENICDKILDNISQNTTNKEKQKGRVK